jgi:hypothetical protein
LIIGLEILSAGLSVRRFPDLNIFLSTPLIEDVTEDPYVDTEAESDSLACLATFRLFCISLVPTTTAKAVRTTVSDVPAEIAMTVPVLAAEVLDAAASAPTGCGFPAVAVTPARQT